jgi:hypothetical protein
MMRGSNYGLCLISDISRDGTRRADPAIGRSVGAGPQVMWRHARLHPSATVYTCSERTPQRHQLSGETCR